MINVKGKMNLDKYNNLLALPKPSTFIVYLHNKKRVAFHYSLSYCLAASYSRKGNPQLPSALKSLTSVF
uniref:hypothetical protein n=1 Tax=Aeribacillus alveayuensis TaxID=279215 RepID=UPI003AF2A3AF